MMRRMGIVSRGIVVIRASGGESEIISLGANEAT